MFVELFFWLLTSTDHQATPTFPILYCQKVWDNLEKSTQGQDWNDVMHPKLQCENCKANPTALRDGLKWEVEDKCAATLSSLLTLHGHADDDKLHMPEAEIK